jgi:acyl-homoserine lactone acylase PvdQ
MPVAFDTSIPLAEEPSPLQLVAYFSATVAQGFGAGDGVLVPAADAPIRRRASNFLIVDSTKSVNDTNMAVMGPQLGYYYPEIVMQIHLSAPGIEAQGAAVPGLCDVPAARADQGLLLEPHLGQPGCARCLRRRIVYHG